MITIDKDNAEIRISETLSFEHHVEPILEDIKEDFRQGFYDKEDEGSVKSFLAYEPTEEDKVKILENIADTYENEGYYDDEDSSIFDVGIIEPAIKDWITEKFDILSF